MMASSGLRRETITSTAPEVPSHVLMLYFRLRLQRTRTSWTPLVLLMMIFRDGKFLASSSPKSSWMLTILPRDASMVRRHQIHWLSSQQLETFKSISIGKTHPVDADQTLTFAYGSGMVRKPLVSTYPIIAKVHLAHNLSRLRWVHVAAQ